MSLSLAHLFMYIEAYVEVNMRKHKFHLYFFPDKNTLLQKVIIESELSVTQKEPLCVNTHTCVTFRLFSYRIACMMGL